MRLQFQKGDWLAIVCTLLLAAVVFALFLPGRAQGDAVAQIYHDGELIRTVELEKPQEFIVTYTCTNTITVRDGKIAITASDCPGEDCVHSGWTSSSGKSIVCLPNQLEIRVVSGDNDVDFVVG